MLYLTMHSTHFIYSYMVLDIWCQTTQIVSDETHCCHMGYSFPLAERVLLYAQSHRQDSTYHNLSYISRGALAGMRNSLMGPPWKINLTTHCTMELHLTPYLIQWWLEWEILQTSSSGIPHLSWTGLSYVINWLLFLSCNPTNMFI